MTFEWFVYVFGAVNLGCLVASGTFFLVDLIEGGRK